MKWMAENQLRESPHGLGRFIRRRNAYEKICLLKCLLNVKHELCRYRLRNVIVPLRYPEITIHKLFSDR